MTCMYVEAIEMIKAKANTMKMDHFILADKSNISPAQVSRIFAFKSTASTETLANMAVAVGLPPTHILEVAKRIPEKPDTDSLTEEGIYILQQLEGENKKDALRYLRMRLEVSQEQGAQDVRKRKTRTAKSG